MVIRPRQLLLVITFTFAALGVSAAANNVYLSQSAQGSGTGADCNNSLAASYFNSSSNWTSSNPTGVKIGPGTTVHLCGTVTTNLTFQGSGSNGSPVVVDGTGATMNAYFSLTGISYFTIQNVTWSTSFQSPSAAISLENGDSNGTIQNDHMDIANPLGNDSNSSRMIWLGSVSHDIVIQNNFFRNAATTNPLQVDILDTSGSYNITVQGNYFETRVQDDSTCAASQNCHDDQIQTWGGCSNWTIRYNEFVMNTTATNNRSWFMIQGLTTGYFDVYRNLFYGIQGADQANGINLQVYNGVTSHVYDNTFYSAAQGPNNMIALDFSGSGAMTLSNNIVYTTNTTALSGNLSGLTRQTNLWYKAGSGSIPSCGGTSDLCGQDPLFANIAGGDFSLQSGSPALGAGTNLGTTYNQYLTPGTAWPNPTLGTAPGTGAWDIGAYSPGGGSGGGVAPPTGLAATVQ